MSGPWSNCVPNAFLWDGRPVVASVAAELTDAITHSGSGFLGRNSHRRMPGSSTRLDIRNCECIIERLELTARAHPSNPDQVLIRRLRDDRWNGFPESIDRYVPEGVENISEWCAQLAAALKQFVEEDGCLDRCDAEVIQRVRELRELLTTITEMSLDGRRTSPPLQVA